MPRTARASVGGICYHAINRGNGSMRVFQNPGDYAAFVELFPRAHDRLPMRLVGFCLMPNHFHLVLWPHEDGDLSRWMQWLLTSHVRRFHRRRAGSGGHVWQGRFKAFPIQQDEHLLTVLRYVERNPVRANLVARAEDWAWSSLSRLRSDAPPPWLHAGPVERPRDWLRAVNRPLSEDELNGLHDSVNRGAPWGGDRWKTRIAGQLDLQSTLRPRGRPRKTLEK